MAIFHAFGVGWRRYGRQPPSRQTPRGRQHGFANEIYKGLLAPPRTWEEAKSRRYRALGVRLGTPPSEGCPKAAIVWYTADLRAGTGYAQGKRYTHVHIGGRIQWSGS